MHKDVTPNIAEILRQNAKAETDARQRALDDPHPVCMALTHIATGLTATDLSAGFVHPVSGRMTILAHAPEAGDRKAFEHIEVRSVRVEAIAREKELIAIVRALLIWKGFRDGLSEEESPGVLVCNIPTHNISAHQRLAVLADIHEGLRATQTQDKP